MKAKSKNRGKRFFYVCLGNVLLGLGVALLRLAGFGTDPFSCMNIGVSNHLPVSYGTYQLMVNLVLFIPAFIFDRKSFGAGAVVNMAGLGYIVDFCMWLFEVMGITIDGMEPLLAVRIILLPVGILCTCFGIALYMDCDMGAAPYDILGQIAEDLTKGKIKFKWARVGMDLCSMTVGYLSGGVVGIATIIVAFFTGPVVSWFRKHATVKLLQGNAG
ncbi:MAG: hypothetical protein NC300_12105 [Bacteroidales bacterium]|nr:hypothetical protein [Clostridium sp.]MCM1204875.1 hypothetical protein [Bacteroidales bacterium]